MLDIKDLGRVELSAVDRRSTKAQDVILDLLDPIVALGLALSVTGTSTDFTNGAGIVDGVRRFLRQIFLTINGKDIQTIGSNQIRGGAGIMMTGLHIWQKQLPSRVDVPDAPAAQFTAELNMLMPIAVPYNRYGKVAQALTAYRRDLMGEARLGIFWGNAGDLLTSDGVESIVAASVDVAAYVDRSLDKNMKGVGNLRQLAIDKGSLLRAYPLTHTINAAANVLQDEDIPKIGLEAFRAGYVYDNGVRDDALVNRVTYFRKTGDESLDLRFQSLQGFSEAVAETNDPAGMETGQYGVVWDRNYDFSGLEKTGLNTGAKVRFDHDGATGVGEVHEMIWTLEKRAEALGSIAS